MITRNRRGLPIAATVMLLTWCVFTSACSKDNEVDDSTHVGAGIGAQCSGSSDGCGPTGVCVLGYCRLGCGTDAECPSGSLCVGDSVPFGCSVASELACSKDKPCAPPLTCSADGKCRVGCKVRDDCPRNEHQCFAGSCVSPSDPNPKWAECNPGEGSCASSPEGDVLLACNVTGPGLASVGTCPKDVMACGIGEKGSFGIGAGCSRAGVGLKPGECATAPALPWSKAPCMLATLLDCAPTQQWLPKRVWVDGVEVPPWTSASGTGWYAACDSGSFTGDTVELRGSACPDPAMTHEYKIETCTPEDLCAPGGVGTCKQAGACDAEGNVVSNLPSATCDAQSLACCVPHGV